MSSVLKTQDGKKITLVVLVATKKEEKENITLLKKAISSQKSPSWSSKGLKENTVWKPGPVTTGDSQRSQEQWSDESPKGPVWKDLTTVFHETGLLIKERKASWYTSCKESQKKGGRFVDTNTRVKESKKRG